MIRRSRAKVLPTIPSDVQWILIEGLRDQDRDEIRAQCEDVDRGVWDTVEASGLLAFTVHVDGVPAGLFGVAPTGNPDTGCVWMVGTDRLLEIRRDLVFEARRWIDYFNEIYPTLTNYVDARNAVSVCWLEVLGFEFTPTGDYVTPDGVVFREFQRCV